MFEQGCRTFVFDGDNVRHGLCSDLGFSFVDRTENIRRIGEMVRLFLEAGVISITAFISPLEVDRERVRRLVSDEDFFEVYCRCPIGVCEERDMKGMYQRARRNEILEFTGISSPYEEPANPNLVLDTNDESVEQSVEKIFNLLLERKIF